MFASLAGISVPWGKGWSCPSWILGVYTAHEQQPLHRSEWREEKSGEGESPSIGYKQEMKSFYGHANCFHWKFIVILRSILLSFKVTVSPSHSVPRPGSSSSSFKLQFHLRFGILIFEIPFPSFRTFSKISFASIIRSIPWRRNSIHWMGTAHQLWPRARSFGEAEWPLGVTNLHNGCILSGRHLRF